MGQVRPIIFTTESVKAILDGRKTMTRRVVKPQPELAISDEVYKANIQKLIGGGDKVCPYGQVGDRLWVREAFWLHKSLLLEQAGLMYWKGRKPAMYFDADMTEHERREDGWLNGWYRKIPSIFMPRWASRLTLEITEVRVERLQEITDEDCFAEGVKFSIKMKEPTAIFRDLWDSINGKKHPWSSNPWVWVIKFDNIGVRVK